MKLAAVGLCALLLAGCSETTKVFDKPVLVERAELIVPPVNPIAQSDVKWVDNRLDCYSLWLCYVFHLFIYLSYKVIQVVPS